MRIRKPLGQILFREVQQFRQTWLWLLLVFACLVSLLPIVDLNLTATQQETPLPQWLIPFILSIHVINMGCFYYTRLETVLTTEGIYYRWAPWLGKYRFLPKTAIREVQILKYPYFKFGYHKRKGFGYVHNTGGNKGFRITLDDNKMFYLGTQKINTIDSIFNKDYSKVYRHTTY